MDGDGCVELGEIRLEGIEVRCEAGRNLASGRVALDGRASASEEACMRSQRRRKGGGVIFGLP